MDTTPDPLENIQSVFDLITVVHEADQDSPVVVRQGGMLIVALTEEPPFKWLLLSSGVNFDFIEESKKQYPQFQMREFQFRVREDGGKLVFGFPDATNPQSLATFTVTTTV